jgi:hypothetical protein
LGQVVGPHGTGKSTLIRALLPGMQQRGWRPLLIQLSAQERRLWRAGGVSPLLFTVLAEEGPRVLVIDGYEQLGWCVRWRLKRACRRGGHGLVVTAHTGVGLPELYRTRVDAALARRVVRALVREDQRSLGNEVDLGALVQAHAGNLRAVLFALYDLYEQRRRP